MYFLIQANGNGATEPELKSLTAFCRFREPVRRGEKKSLKQNRSSSENVT